MRPAQCARTIFRRLAPAAVAPAAPGHARRQGGEETSSGEMEVFRLILAVEDNRAKIGTLVMNLVVLQAVEWPTTTWPRQIHAHCGSVGSALALGELEIAGI